MSANKKKLCQFLKKYKYIKENKDHQITHTRIGSKASNIYGGSYNIPKEAEEEFYKLYYEHVFKNKCKEYLTEVQLVTNPTLLIDIDMRYNLDAITRQYKCTHIIDLIQLYLDELEKIVHFDNRSFDIYILEKDNPNITDNCIKDGIHIIFGLCLEHNVQKYLRDNIIKEIDNIWNDLPLINNWESVFDEGISLGHVNWQLYGSRKPGYEPYKLSKMYKCQYDQEFELNEVDIKTIKYDELLSKISARSNQNIKFDIKPDVLSKIKPIKKRLKIKGLPKIKTIEQVTSKEELDLLEKQFLEDIDSNEKEDNVNGSNNYYLKEIHNYTMILPEEYYGPGSYQKWIRVGWALRMTSNKMLLTWVKFSSQSSEFNYTDIPELCEMWNRIDTSSKERKLSMRSIIYWAKESGCPKKYKEIRNNSINYYILETLKEYGDTDHNFATVLFNMLKGKFICVSIKYNLWYEYKNHRWNEIDSGTTLRAYISKEMHREYVLILKKKVDTIAQMESETSEFDTQKKVLAHLHKVQAKLKTTSDKDKIMKEARELFYDKNFIEEQDSKPYLLGFTNGVFDFQENKFRPGRPDDYIVKSTNYDYKPKHMCNPEHINEVEQFIEQLFPIAELREYMWEHLASTLIGTNENQTFNIYTGSGRNGKSMLVLLMGKVLGDYKGTVPVTLITQKRTSIGGTSSELVALKGVRYAVMQEPSKGDKINEGIMKELTGGDPLQCRALFCNSITYIPQFKLVCCLNELFEIVSQDDGTWRRIRVCDFKSKFTENPVNDDPDEPYQFKVNKKLEEKFNEWKGVMMSILIEKAKETNGNVNDCSIVLSKSQEYREGQDYIYQFIKERIITLEGSTVKKREVAQEFREWYQTNYGNKGKDIRDKELYKYMIKYYGAYKAGGWKNISIVYEDYEDGI